MEPEGFNRIEGEGDGNPLPHLSFSRINRYLTCPEQYRLYYVEGLRPELSPASLAFGQAIHKSLAGYFVSGIHPVTTFRSIWDSLKDEPLRYGRVDSWDKLCERGILLLARFVIYELPKLSCVEAIEKPFELSISNLEVPFVGIIDLAANLEGVKTVIDFKTASTSYQEHEVKLSDQLSSYQLAHPDAEKLAFCVLVKTKEPRIEWYLTQRGSPELQEFLSKAEIVGQQIQDGLFYKRPGKWCAWCDFLSLCVGGHA